MGQADGKVLPAVQVEMSSEQKKTWVLLSGEGPRLQSRYDCLRIHVRPYGGGTSSVVYTVAYILFPPLPTLLEAKIT